MPSLHSAVSEPPVHHHDPHLLDLRSAREVPESHLWSPHVHDHPPSYSPSTDPVPIVDISDPDAAAVLDLIARACTSWGVFQLTGHGISPRLLDRVEAETWRLFALPVERKLKAARPPGGISGYGIPKISSFFQKLMWFEGFTIADAPLAHAQNLWPDNPLQFCDVIEEYIREMKKLSRKLISLVLRSLGITEEEMAKLRPVGEWKELSSVLQLNSYPVCPEPDRAMGLAAHTDSSLLTLLHQSSTTGLQVLRVPDDDRHGPARWATVLPLPGALVVNVGDLLHILSNGRYESVVHRAVVNRSRHRVSVAYMSFPPAHVKVSPVEKLVGPGERPAYRPVVWADYLGLKGKLFDKALASIRVAADESCQADDDDIIHSVTEINN